VCWWADFWWPRSRLPHVMIGFHYPPISKGGIFITSKWNFGHQEGVSMYLHIDLCKFGIGSHEDNKSEAK